LIHDSPHAGKHLDNNQNIFGTIQYPGANYPNGWQVATAATEYAFNGTGPYAAVGTLAMTYWTTDNRSSDPNFSVQGAVGNILSSTSDLLVKVVQTQVALINSKMEGEVTLHSSDPFDAPNVIMDLWTHQEDIDAAIAGFRLQSKLATSYPLNTVYGATVSPPPSVVTDEQLTEFIIQNGSLAGHWSSTARIGNDPSTSVCDPQLRVRGVTGLRVGDTSAVPFYGFHIQATAVMVGERAADFVLQDAHLF